MKASVRSLFLLLLTLFLITLPAACSKDTPSSTADASTASPAVESTPQTPVSDSGSISLPSVAPTVSACQTHTPSANQTYCTTCYTILTKDPEEYQGMIYFACSDETLTEAYKIAITDCLSNVKPFRGGLITTPQKCIIAGADYTTPWTRDAAINVWNAFALLDGEVSKNTLFSVLKKIGNRYYIDGQYWDAMIWAIGAYQYYLVSNDNEFLEIAQNAVTNSLAKFEREEFDAADNLFRGAAVYGDGVAAYPDRYANSGSSGIESWVNVPENANQVVNIGVGLPMKALSTNCVYYQSYILLAKMNELLGISTESPLKKAAALKDAINKHFWNEEKGTYDYLAYECDYQEALGISFALLFGIADERKTALVLQNTYSTAQGIACVWPSFDRYLTLGGYGRHAGTVWPHAQGFWARACSENGFTDGFEHELYTLAEKAVRDGQFYEIYHPDTGEVYGGLQGYGSPTNNDIFLWGSCSHQTWSATAYLSCIYYEILGATIEKDSITFDPYLPTGVNEATISGLKVGNTTFNIILVRGDQYAASASFSTTSEGSVTVTLAVK